jgi:hypothetical protein
MAKDKKEKITLVESDFPKTSYGVDESNSTAHVPITEHQKPSNNTNDLNLNIKPTDPIYNSPTFSNNPITDGAYIRAHYPGENSGNRPNNESGERDDLPVDGETEAERLAREARNTQKTPSNEDGEGL